MQLVLLARQMISVNKIYLAVFVQVEQDLINVLSTVYILIDIGFQLILLLFPSISSPYTNFKFEF
jgi:hypothetical protein